MQRKDLIPIADGRGLPTWGTQAQIAARLAAADQTAATVPPKEIQVVKVMAGPDTGADSDSGHGILQALTDSPPEPPPAPEREIDPLLRENMELRAQLLQMQAALTSRPGERPTGGDAATPDVIAQALRGEQVFRTEFPMYQGMELGDGLHQAFITQTAQRAAEAGYRTRGGAHRTGWGRDKDGNRTAVYEIYARKEG